MGSVARSGRRPWYGHGPQPSDPTTRYFRAGPRPPAVAPHCHGEVAGTRGIDSQEAGKDEREEQNGIALAAAGRGRRFLLGGSVARGTGKTGRRTGDGKFPRRTVRRNGQSAAERGIRVGRRVQRRSHAARNRIHQGGAALPGPLSSTALRRLVDRRESRRRCITGVQRSPLRFARAPDRAAGGKETVGRLGARDAGAGGRADAQCVGAHYRRQGIAGTGTGGRRGPRRSRPARCVRFPAGALRCPRPRPSGHAWS